MIANSFDDLLEELNGLCNSADSTGSTREMSIVATKLEEACFFAKKAMANNVENQDHGL